MFALDDPIDTESQANNNDWSRLSTVSCSCSEYLDDTQVVYTFDLQKTYAIDAVLAIGGKHTGLPGGWDVYIGQDPDYSNNDKCPGGPFN